MRNLQKVVSEDMYLVDLGLRLVRTGKKDEAINCFERAIVVNPNLTPAYINLGKVLTEKDDYKRAIHCFDNVLSINPKNAEAMSLLCLAKRKLCEWDDIEKINDELNLLVENANKKGEFPGEHPFESISRTDSVKQNFQTAKWWGNHFEKKVEHIKRQLDFKYRKKRKGKINIGYFSSDFRDHPVSHLMVDLFGQHDRKKFKVSAYYYGQYDDSYYRKKIEKDCDEFVVFKGLDIVDAARMINKDEIDILIDLVGYTKGLRPELLALKPAPIQVGYLGYPGTSGASYMDYFITDKIITPPSDAKYYTEKFVYMPDCHQINSVRRVSKKKMRRSDFNLPEKIIVFSSFNQHTKIDLLMFNTWMNILKRVKESVLWLSEGNVTSRKNLKEEAKKKGVDSSRLIFTKKIPRIEDHLARQKLADVALDTRIYNGHTTTSNALWVGLPVVTLKGNHNASRVAASLLYGIGAKSLVAESSDEYENIATSLVNETNRLNNIKTKLSKGKKESSLFDTKKFTKNLENSYSRMYETYLSAEKTKQIEL